MAKKNTLFGYGSLILPQSLLSRFDEQVRQNALNYGTEGKNLGEMLEYLLKPEIKEKARAMDLRLIPARIYGFKRLYALELSYSGNQLVAVEDENEFINGVIIDGLTDSQYEKIAETEKHYTSRNIDKGRIDSYVDTSLPEEPKIFVAENEKAYNLETKRKRDLNYEKFLIEGVRALADEWFDGEERESFIRDFMRDYRSSTFQREDGEWKRLSEIEEGQ